MTRPTVEVVAPGLVMLHEAVPMALEAAVLAFLAEVPEVPVEELDRTQQFAFTRPLDDGSPIAGRAEACAGDPIWVDGPSTGVSMPPALTSLRDLLAETVTDTFDEHRTDMPPMTSVYIDRYDEGGRFVAHTDREIYGPVVAGVSLGDGWGTLTFANRNGDVVRTELHSRSVYLMGEPLRFPPWTHRFDLHEGRRWAVTYRSGATEGTRTSRSIPNQ